MTQTPARGFYRYLVLSGKSSDDIANIFESFNLFVPERNDKYYEEQLLWAAEKIKKPKIESPKALALVGFSDMLAAHRNKPAGRFCREALSILCRPDYREAMETLLLAGWEDWEVRGAINSDITRPYMVSLEAVAAYRKYFFDPSILSYKDKKTLAFIYPWLRYAISSIDPELLEEAVGLRYSAYQDRYAQARDMALSKWLVTLSMTPVRTDREGLKSLASFLSSLKSLEPAGSSELDNRPMVELVRERLELEGGE